MSSLDLTLNNYYNISTYAPVLFGNNLRNLKLVSILDYNTAIKFSNIELQQQQIKPYLPVNSPFNPINYTYYKFKDNNGKDYVIADLWIIPSSIEEVLNTTITIVLNNVTTGDVPILRDQLKALGYNFTITVS